MKTLNKPEIQLKAKHNQWYKLDTRALFYRACPVSLAEKFTDSENAICFVLRRKMNLILQQSNRTIMLSFGIQLNSSQQATQVAGYKGKEA